MLEKIIKDKIEKGLLLNLEPKLIILGSNIFNNLHFEKLGWIPFQKNQQLQEYQNIKLEEDMKNKERIDILFSIKELCSN